MSTPQLNSPQLLAAHAHDLGGGFVVRRLLPAAQRQAVGRAIASKLIANK
ncbi:MAG: hypothetical protein Q8R67_25160 [Rhodoferax sp.]|nr:hypothetical protein [Rhodoferax sp.]MDP3654963.1 hypothetical protein [Rhodoferax sp.]